MGNKLRSLAVFLLISALLSLFMSQGFAENVDLIRRGLRIDQPNNPLHHHEEKSMKISRKEMREIETNDDYDGTPKANPRNGPLLNPPTPPPPPPPLPSPSH